MLATTETFKIGSRTFARRSYATPHDVNFSNARGEKTDYCRNAAPGLPFDNDQAALNSLNKELPEGTVELKNVGAMGARQ